MSDRFRKLLIPLAAILAIVAWLIVSDRDDRPHAPDERPDRPPEASEPASDPVPEAQAVPDPDPPAPPDAPTGEWTLTVRTEGPDGTPLTEQYVARFLPPGDPRPSRRLVTDKVAEFTLDVRGPGSLVVSCASAPLPPVRIPDLTPPPSGERVVTVRFVTGRTLEGELFHQDGVTPVEGRVLVMPVDRESWHGTPPRLATAGEDGRWRAEGLVPGRYKLMADAKDRGHGRRPDPAPQAEAGGPPVRIVLLPVTRVTVRVLVDGEPPEKSGLTILTVTDEKGGSIVSTSWIGSPACEREYFVPPGQAITVGVDSKGYERSKGQTIRIAPDALEVEVEVRMTAAKGPTGTLVFRPKDSLGRPVTTLTVYRKVTESVEHGEELTVDGGTAELVLPVGEARLRITGPGNARYPVSPYLEKTITVSLEPGERKVVDIELVVGGWIRVFDYKGKHDELFAGPTGSEPATTHLRSFREQEGRVLNRGEPVAPGKWVVEWRRKGTETIRHEVVVRPGMTAIVTF